MSRTVPAPITPSRFLTRGAVTPEHAAYLKAVRLRRLAVLAVQIGIVVCFFWLWEYAADHRWIDPFITSQPSRMWATLVNLSVSGQIWRHVGTTVAETIAGFTGGTVLGVLVAIMLWWSDFLSRVLDPYLVVLNATPKEALGPVFIVWLGAGVQAILVMALAVSVVVTILMVYSGFRQVDENKVKLVRTFGARRWQILTKVILPASVPTIVSALKVNVGLSLIGVIVGEFLVSRAGLGYLIIYGGQVFQLSLVMTSVFILIAVAAVLYQLVSYLERAFTRWRA
ncbi:MAG: ABC transporter permease [Chloroflexota bacterium]